MLDRSQVYVCQIWTLKSKYKAIKGAELAIARAIIECYFAIYKPLLFYQNSMLAIFSAIDANSTHRYS